MVEPPFQSELSDAQLADLGRLSVNLGYVELLLDWLIGAAWGLSNEAQRQFVSPRSLEQKIKDLRDRLDECQNDDAKAAIQEALELASGVRGHRNALIHGYWALQNGVGMRVFRRKGQAAQDADVRPLDELADSAARAGNRLYFAFDVLNGRDPTRVAPDTLSPNHDGSFLVARKAVPVKHNDSS